MLEELIKELILALDRNTAARLGEELGERPITPAADTAAPKGSVAGRKAAAAEKKEKEAEPKKTEKVTHETIRTLVTNERERLGSSVSTEAVAQHKVESAKILEKFGAASITKLEEKDLAAAYKLFQAIDCSVAPEPEDEDDL